MSQRRVLITGATGGLGIALVAEALARGHDVVATGRREKAGARIESMGARFVAADLVKTEADLPSLLTGCDSVIHAAALSASWGPERDFVEANLALTRRLLAAAASEGVSRFVFVSSPSIFAQFEDRISIGEDDAPKAHPLNAYARTKLAAERLVLAPRDDSLACCAIRPRALVGPGDRVILPRLAELARRPRMPLPRGGKARIELTDLRDAAWAICEAEERAPSLAGRAINISGGQPRAVRDIAVALAGALGTNPRLVSLPLGLARPLASVLEAFAHLVASREEPVLTRYTLATLAYSQSFDLEPARRLLGYEPQHDALETLLEEARSMSAAEVTT